MTTYKSKYFNPRFLEVFLFGKTEQGWMLRRIMVYPSLPPRPEMYEVEVFLGQYVTDRQPLRNFEQLRDLEKEMIAEGPDTIEKYISLRKTVPGSFREHYPSVILFREPPPEGALIEISEQQREFQRDSHGSVVRVAQGGNPYFLLAGSGWYGSNYTVWVQVTMDGVKITDDVLRLQ
jgi:hypothetical protein